MLTSGKCPITHFVRQEKFLAAGEEDAFFIVGVDLYPSGQIAARIVPSERNSRAIVVGAEQVRLDEYLKTVADAKDELACGAKFLHHIGQMMANLVGKNTASRNVVAKTKAAGDAEDLGLGGQQDDCKVDF